MSDLIKVWDIPGGIHPPENKEQSLQLPIGEISLPSEMVFPLSQHIGTPALAIVAVGDIVLAGQKIAAAVGPFSAPIHASTSGVITAIEDRPIPHSSGMPGECIVLKPDGQDTSIELHGCEDYLALTNDDLLQRIREAGISGMGGAGFPSAIKLKPRPDYDIKTLIVNGTECEPYITADDILMQTRADDIIKGTQLLAHILNNPERVVIGVEDNKPDAIAALKAASANNNIEIAVFPTKYPSGGEKQLIQILTGQEVPSGGLPSSIGIVMQNVGTAVAIYEAIRYGKPLIERITTVVGEALEVQRNIKVRLGTPVAHVLQEHGFQEQKADRIIMGGPMMGFSLQSNQTPIVKTSNCILAPSKVELPSNDFAQACIRCGLCAEVCPASLLPQQLYWYAQAKDYDRIQAHNLMDCIECGACSFVCPSSIPLVQHYRAAKGTVRQMAAEKEHSDRSRRRFEFRQERIDKAEAEKDAKRLARKEAAAAAKKKLADAPTSTNTSANSSAQTTNAVVAAALASSSTQTLAPAEQQAKLERAVSSAESKVDRLRTKVHDADESQAGKLAAQIKQAELKLAEAHAKLTNFKQNPTANQNESTSPAPDKDPVAAAIARAQAKMLMPPDEKLKASLVSLNQRLGKAEEKLTLAKSNNADTVDALQMGLDKLKEKIATAEHELAQLADNITIDAPAQSDIVPAVEMDAASAAIEKAKLKAQTMASMSAEEKLKAQIESLEKRLSKAQQRLVKAEAEQDENIDAFRAGVEKTQIKLDEAKAQLA